MVEYEKFKMVVSDKSFLQLSAHLMPIIFFVPCFRKVFFEMLKESGRSFHVAYLVTVYLLIYTQTGVDVLRSFGGVENAVVENSQADKT